jgi:hypothetical protein
VPCEPADRFKVRKCPKLNREIIGACDKDTSRLVGDETINGGKVTDNMFQWINNRERAGRRRWWEWRDTTEYRRKVIVRAKAGHETKELVRRKIGISRVKGIVHTCCSDWNEFLLLTQRTESRINRRVEVLEVMDQEDSKVASKSDLVHPKK